MKNDPGSLQLEKAHTKQWRPSTAKTTKKLIKILRKVNVADTVCLTGQTVSNSSQGSLFSGFPNQELPKILSSLLASNVCWMWAVCKMTIPRTPKTPYMYHICFKACPLLSHEVSRRPHSPQCINKHARTHERGCSLRQALHQAVYTHSVI